jgi:acyl-CoA synthetase (NDP forming)
MKIDSPDIAHKTDVGGVKVNIRDEAEWEKAFYEITEAAKSHPGRVRINGVMLQKMITGGMELIIGGRYDHDFGPVIMFGMGGIFVETLKDVSFRLAPICSEESYEMIEETRGFTLLKGTRGEKEYDISSLADVLERVSVLLSDFSQLVELDLNPVKIFDDGRGLIVLDARLRAVS